MTPEQIQKALKKRKITQKSIARNAKRSEMLVSLVINRKSTSNPIMTAVAQALGKPKEMVFPDYYLEPRLRGTSKALGKSG